MKEFAGFCKLFRFVKHCLNGFFLKSKVIIVRPNGNLKLPPKVPHKFSGIHKITKLFIISF